MEHTRAHALTVFPTTGSTLYTNRRRPIRSLPETALHRDLLTGFAFLTDKPLLAVLNRSSSPSWPTYRRTATALGCASAWYSDSKKSRSTNGSLWNDTTLFTVRFVRGRHWS